jgi:membrane-bound ClpP family serine protease
MPYFARSYKAVIVYAIFVMSLGLLATALQSQTLIHAAAFFFVLGWLLFLIDAARGSG